MNPANVPRPSIRRQLARFFYFSLGSFALFWIVSVLFMLVINHRQLTALEKQTNVQAYFLQLNLVQDQLQDLMLLSDEGNSTMPFTLSCYALRNTANRISRDYPSRTIFEQEKRAEAYLEYAAQAVRIRQAGDDSYQEAYNRASYVRELIQEQFNATYDDVDSYTAVVIARCEKEQMMMTAFIGLSLLLAFLLGIRFVKEFSRRLADPILTLAHSATMAGQGAYHPVKEMPGAAKELRLLSECFSEMYQKIRQQMDDLKLMGDMKYRILQAQINPHFLFNTLNMIQQLVFMEKPEKAMEAISLLSKVLRYSLSEEKSVAIAREIEYAENYMKIQRIRYEERLRCVTSTDETVLSSVLPLMILQPIIENSILHGMNRDTASLEVRVTIKRTGERISMTVADNGKGMTKEEIEALVKKLEGRTSRELLSKPSIGLYNIYQRMRLFFGKEEVSMRVESTPYQLTQIELAFPFLLQEAGDDGIDDRRRGN